MLEADAHHVFAAVMTTAGMLVGVLLVARPQWSIFDLIVALVVAVNMLWTGIKLLCQAGLRLLDIALPPQIEKPRTRFETVSKQP